MDLKNFIFKSKDGTDIFAYNWIPDDNVKVKGIVQIAHGMAETAAGYERFAENLTKNGYIVYINDHRGHGKTAGTIENVGYLAEEDGFNWLVKDLHQLSEIIKKENTELPLFLFGHSMGSFVTQRYMMLYGIKDVTCKLYKGGIHEMLNETNKDEVMKDVVDRLNDRCLRTGVIKQQ